MALSPSILRPVRRLCRAWLTRAVLSSVLVAAGAAASAQTTADTPPAGYTRCASEGQTCSFSGTANVVYGARSTWSSPRSYTGGTACGNAVFGDPLYGVPKACYYQAGATPALAGDAPAGYTLCASEGQTCSFSGQADVVYGARGTWSNPRSFTGGTACGNAVFGDPLYGVPKACYQRAAAATPFSLTVTASAGGSVTSAPTGIDCGAVCSASFSSGASVTLSAAPASGHVFDGWRGSCAGTGVCSVAMNAAKSVTASFTEAPLCSTTPAFKTGGSIRLALAASRASGVAPLSVFFDATATISNNTARPFHEIEYRWNFGETTGPGAGAWNRGSRAGVSSRNAATGPVAAHVFETPGEYVVSLKDASNTVSNQCRIKVDKPDEVFSGARTVCFSSSQDFGGCPQGAGKVSTADFSVVVKAATTTNTVRRLLLRRGDHFSAGAMGTIAVPGPGLIGAFGSGPKPVIHATPNFVEGPVLAFSSPSTPAIADWRLMDVTIDGSSNPNSLVSGVGAQGGIDQLTLLRVNPNAVRVGVLMSDSTLDVWNADGNAIRHGHHIWDQVSIVDMDVTNMPPSIPVVGGGTYGSFLSGERVFYAENAVDGKSTQTAATSHNARFPYLGKAVIANNSLARPGRTEHSIKLHAPLWGDSGVSGRGIGGGYSRWIVIADNLITSAYNNWDVTVGPQGNDRDERVKDVILERNFHTAGPATGFAQVIWADDVTSRNNVINTSGAKNPGGIAIGRRSITPAADHVSVYHNTIYNGDASSEFSGVTIAADVTHATVKNNLGYVPAGIRPLMISGTGSAAAPLVAGNNTVNLRDNPQFVGPLTTLAGFKIAPGSYAARAGAIGTPVYSDAFGVDRPANVAPDLGAFKP